MSTSKAPSNQPCGSAKPVHSPLMKLSELSGVRCRTECPDIQYTHAPSSVTASIMARKNAKVSSLRSMAYSYSLVPLRLVAHAFQPHASVPTVEVDKSSKCSQRDDAQKHEPPLRFPDHPEFERVRWLQHAIRYGLA